TRRGLQELAPLAAMFQPFFERHPGAEFGGAGASEPGRKNPARSTCHVVHRRHAAVSGSRSVGQTASVPGKGAGAAATANRPAEAEAAYRQALVRDPQQVRWRYELAELLHEQGKLPECRRELNTILYQQPGFREAEELRKIVGE